MNDHLRLVTPCVRRIHESRTDDRRVEVWQRERGGHRIEVLELRPITALRGRFGWREIYAEEHGPDEATAILRAGELLARTRLP